MNRIDDTTLSIVLKLAAKASTDEDVEMYKQLDVSDCEISERVRRKFRRNLAWEFGRSTRQKILQVTKTVAVACLALCTLVFGTAMCIEPVRTAFVEAVVTWYEDYIGFRLLGEEKMEYPTTIEKVYLPGNLSDEWVVTKENQFPTVVTHNIARSSNETIRLVQSIITNDGEEGLDNTGVQLEKIKLTDGTPAYLARYEDGRYALRWWKEYYFKILSDNVTVDILMDIAEGLK